MYYIYHFCIGNFSHKVHCAQRKYQRPCGSTTIVQLVYAVDIACDIVAHTEVRAPVSQSAVGRSEGMI